MPAHDPTPTDLRPATVASHRPEDQHLEAAFRREEIAALRMAMYARFGALVVIGIWLALLLGLPAATYYHALLIVFALIGLCTWLGAVRWGVGQWISYVAIVFDFALMTFTLLYPNPLADTAWPRQMELRNGTFVYFFVILAGMAFSYSPAFLLWGGLVAAGAWAIGVMVIVNLPGTITPATIVPDMTAAQLLARHLDPLWVDTDVLMQATIVFLIVAGILAAVVWRSRRLVARQSRIARERANLARHFAPNIVDELAGMDQPLGDVRVQPVAVLFADIVGFTRMAEHEEPAEIVALLRAFHSRLESIVFEHGGTLDKFLGDGIMATFGTPRATPHDAASALACAAAMLTSIDAWNIERRGLDKPPIRLSIGIHHGDVVLGDIGSKRRLEYAVLGDVVNVASRLEHLTRRRECQLIVSDDVIRSARDRGDDARIEPMLDRMQRLEDQTVRGREASLGIWTLGEAPAD